MATYIGPLNAVNYIFNSSEISTSKVPGISMVGAICLAIDNGNYYIVEDDLTLTASELGISERTN